MTINKQNMNFLIYYSSLNKDKLLEQISLNEKILRYTKSKEIVDISINKLLIINDLLK